MAVRRTTCLTALLIDALLLLGGCSRSSAGPSGAVDETRGSDSGRGTGSAGEQTSEAATTDSTAEAGTAAPAGDGGNHSITIRITTNTLEPEEVPPIPEGFELLYVTGKDVPGRLEVFLVDGEMLYWAQRAGLWRAPKDGSGEPKAFGYWDTTNQGSSLLADEAYIYWQDGPHIKRKRKDTPHLSVSTPRYTYNFPWVDDHLDERYRAGIETIEYGAEHSFAFLTMDEHHVYAIPSSCTAVHKIETKTLEVHSFEVPRSEYSGGNTAVTMDDTHIYCGNINHLFRIRKDGSGFEILYEDFATVWSLVSSPDKIFAMDRAGAAVPRILAFSKADGEVSDMGQGPIGGVADSYRAPLQFDSARQHLYWGMGWVMGRDMQTGAFFASPRLGLSFAFTSDADYLYWGGQPQPGAGSTVVTILRLHKDRLATALVPD